MIHCVKLNQQAEGLEQPPFPGAEGLRIYENVSAQAWEEWKGVQTMLINENRLASFEPAARKLIAEEREKFLFAGSNEMPEGYVPPKG